MNQSPFSNFDEQRGGLGASVKHQPIFYTFPLEFFLLARGDETWAQMILTNGISLGQKHLRKLRA